jgi:predicted transcriptional regulator
MTTVKKIIDQKASTIFSVRTTDPVENVLKIMRDFRVRAVLVIDDNELKGIVSQGDCAIKVLLPHLNPTQVVVSKISGACKSGKKCGNPLRLTTKTDTAAPLTSTL